jgi:chromosome segregation ATPase
VIYRRTFKLLNPRRKSLEVLTNPNSLKVQLEKAQDEISILELKLETSQRELSELNSLTEENKHLKEQAGIKQQQMESLRKDLEETDAKLISVQNELDKSLAARLQGLKDFGAEYEKRKLVQSELNSTVEESSEALITQDQLLTKLRTENFKLKQTNQSLARDLTLVQKLVESRKVPYFENEFNGLNYFKYFVYLLIAAGFVLVLMRKREVNHD